MTRSWSCLLAAVGLLFFVAGPARADLQGNLDKPLDLSAANVPVAELFEMLSRKTGVRFEIDQRTLDCLPAGGQTRLSRVTLRDVTLRDALTPLLAPQALRWTIRGDRVEVLPTDALYRMVRRATYAELETLGRLHSARIEPAEANATADGMLRALRAATGSDELQVIFQTPKTPSEAQLGRGARAALPGPGADWLDALAAGSDWSWYLRGERIMILEASEQVQRQVQRKVTLQYDGASISEVLSDLARLAGVSLDVEPGVLGRVAEPLRSDLSLKMSDASILDALAVIGGTTGLTLGVDENGITVTSSEHLDRAEAGRGDQAFLVRLKLRDADGVELLIRSDQLPADLARALLHRKARALEDLRRDLAIPADAPGAEASSDSLPVEPWP